MPKPNLVQDVEDESGQVTTVYRPGDNIVGCLNDIFKLSRLDEEDDERTVARTFARTNLMAELVTVIVELSDKGAFGRKVGSKAGVSALFCLTGGAANGRSTDKVDSSHTARLPHRSPSHRPTHMADRRRGRADGSRRFGRRKSGLCVAYSLAA
jgi:hypothetical protein